MSRTYNARVWYRRHDGSHGEIIMVIRDATDLEDARWRAERSVQRDCGDVINLWIKPAEVAW